MHHHQLNVQKNTNVCWQWIKERFDIESKWFRTVQQIGQYVYITKREREKTINYKIYIVCKSYVNISVIPPSVIKACVAR